MDRRLWAKAWVYRGWVCDAERNRLCPIEPIASRDPKKPSNTEQMFSVQCERANRVMVVTRQESAFAVSCWGLEVPIDWVRALRGGSKVATKGVKALGGWVQRSKAEPWWSLVVGLGFGSSGSARLRGYFRVALECWRGLSELATRGRPHPT